MQFRSLQNVCVSGWAPIFLEAESVVSQESSRPSSRMATKSEGDDCLGGSTTTVFADHFPRETFWVFHIYVSLPCGKHINIVETTKQKFYTKFEFMNPASVKKTKNTYVPILGRLCTQCCLQSGGQTFPFKYKPRSA